MERKLAAISSVVDATQCAIEIQRELRSRNAALVDSRRMQFRIGINLGDVIVEQQRLYGDGVNIAARVESLAQGGGVCLSGTAYDQVEGKLPFGYDFPGEQIVKNIARPVRVYRLRLEPGASPVSLHGERRAGRRRMLGVAGAIVFLILLGAGGWAGWRWLGTPASSGLALPDKPSVAVLPFTNLSRDPAQEYFSDGVTEDLITGLSKISGLFVIARNSAFTYKGKAVKVGDVARDLGVRYVLEGGVQRAGSRVRITAQLVDATTGYLSWAHLNSWQFMWSTDPESLERARELAERAIALDGTLAEGYRLLGQIHLWKKEHDRAIAQAERAVAIAPNDADAYETLAEVLGWAGRPEESIQLIRQAMRLDPHYPFFYLWTLGHAYYVARRNGDALDTFNMVLQQNPNFFPAHAYLAVLFTEMGQVKRAREAWNRASRLSPSVSSSHVRQHLPYRRSGALDRLLPPVAKLQET